METVILGLFIGIPAVLVLAAMVAWYRTSTQQFKIDES
jgi:hypothetical protein